MEKNKTPRISPGCIYIEVKFIVYFKVANGGRVLATDNSINYQNVPRILPDTIEPGLTTSEAYIVATPC